MKLEMGRMRNQRVGELMGFCGLGRLEDGRQGKQPTASSGRRKISVLFRGVGGRKVRLHGCTKRRSG